MTLSGRRRTGLRVAGAPISWGVCEVPGWGHQLPAERVLAEMERVGLAATEFGPAGFLPEDPAAKKLLLDSYSVQAVGGFLPVLLHDSDHDPMPGVDEFIDTCLATEAGVVVLAAASGVDGYDDRPILDDAHWKTMLTNLDRICDHAAERGVIAVIHPHIGTMVESADDVQRVLDGSHVGLCIDTGHLVAAGADPVEITKANLDRVKHVHLKDVNAEIAAQVISKEMTFSDAVAAGLFCVLGTGSVDLTSMLQALSRADYAGWYVLEQDVMFTHGPPDGEGPVADVRACLEFVEAVLV